MELIWAKVKESHNRPGVAQRVPAPGFHDIRHAKVVRSAPRTGRLYPQECSWYSFSLSRPQAMEWWEGDMSLKNPMTPPGIDSGTVRLVAQHVNHYATPGPHMGKTSNKCGRKRHPRQGSSKCDLTGLCCECMN
jgi:hypothetical protein